MPNTKKAVKKETAKPIKSERYIEAVGRRKTAIARVRLFSGGKDFLVNTKTLAAYFPVGELQKIATSPLDIAGFLEKFGVLVKVKGGGLHAQAEAIRHAIARALTLFSPETRGQLKKAGFLTRDPRMRERKKFGLKRARKAPQWAKR